MRQNIRIGTFGLMILAIACGGGGGGTTGTTPPPPKTWADTLVYADPAGSGYRWVKNGSLSTASRLTLELIGPTGKSGRGLSFIMNLDAAKVTWGNPAGSPLPVQNVAFTNLGPGVPVLVGKVGGSGNGTLQGAIFQKSGSQPLNQILARVSMDLKSAAVPVNSSVSLSFTDGREISDAGVLAPISISIGSLSAQ